MGAASHGFGWKYIHSMQRFWRGFWHFVIFDNLSKFPPKPLHGMGVLVVFWHFVKNDQNSLRV